MGKFIDLTGQRFGRWMVLKRAENAPDRSPMWLCRCDCGNLRVVIGRNLRNGASTSCGCQRRESLVQRNLIHGQCQTRLYHIWQAMRSRCGNSNDCRYNTYGGRGISVCEEWRQSFEKFQTWALVSGYRNDLTIDRIDVNGNYCPENCRWVDLIAQAQNKRNSRHLTYNGKTLPLSVWAAQFGISKYTLRSRLRYGWPVEKALTEPVKNAKKE